MTGKRRVTVVNDYPEFLEMMADFLTEEGYEVTTIPKHQGAFHQIKQSQPDLIICDIVFDNEPHGFGLIDMLYLTPETRKIPLIVCTAASRRVKEMQSSLAARGIRWIEKPFAIERLLELLVEILSPQQGVSPTSDEPQASPE
jgi:CheY-like chemotaxis protein